METDGSLVTKDSFDSHHDPKATAVDAEEDREPEGFSGTFLIASPAAFKTGRFARSCCIWSYYLMHLVILLVLVLSFETKLYVAESHVWNLTMMTAVM